MTKPTIAIVQARMGSERLPGKVLLDLGGRPVLDWVLDRLRPAAKLDGIVVATSTEPADDAIADHCQAQGVPCFRGSEADVLDRYYQAARAFDAAKVVRVTADCPFVEASSVDEVVSAMNDTGADYCSNQLAPRRTAVGSDVEAFRFEALALAWARCRRPDWREHVTPYIYLSGDFRVHAVHHDLDESWVRITLDTPEDLELLRAIVREFGEREFRVSDVRDLLLARPELVSMNVRVQQRAVLPPGQP